MRIQEIRELISKAERKQVEKAFAECVGNDDVWLKIYQYGLFQKIKPRKGLVEKYQKLLKK